MLGPSDSLKLNFQIVQKGTDEGVQPHQVFLRFYDSKTDEEGIVPLRVPSTGKVKFDLVSPNFISFLLIKLN